MTSAGLAYFLAAAYPLALTMYLRVPARRMSAGVVPLTLPPLLVTGAAAWIGLAHVAQGRAAGIESILATIAAGAIASGVCAATALLVVARTEGGAAGPLPRSAAAISTLCLAMTVASLVMTREVFRRDPFTMWNVSLIAAFIALTLLVPLAVIAVIGQTRPVARRSLVAALVTILAATVAVTVAALRFAHA